MPKVDGITVLKKMRAAGNRTPVLLLTAKSEVDDKVLGLDSGADDYLTKPFHSKELFARIRAITRRQESSGDSLLTLGNVSLDLSNFYLSTSQNSLRLSNKEYQMMEMLMMQPKHVISTQRF